MLTKSRGYIQQGFMKKILYINVIMFAIFLLFIIYGKYESNNNSNYIQNLNLELKGKVTKIIKLNHGHDYGIISLNIESSNRNYYDERESVKRFFGVIRNNKAEIIVTNISHFELNDVFMINKNKYSIIRGYKIIDENYFSVPSGIISPYHEIRSKVTL